MRDFSWRTPIAAIAGIVAVVGIVAGGLGLWTLRVAEDSDRFERRVQQLLQTDEVSEALATRIVDEITTAVDLRAAVDDYVPDLLQGPADLLFDGLRARAANRVAEYIASDSGSELIAQVAGRAHARIIAVLEGDGLPAGLSVEGEDVRLNLLPLVSRGLTEIQGIGLLSHLDIPELTFDGDPDTQRNQLEAAIGRDLPADFGTPVIYSSEKVAEVDEIVSNAQRTMVLAHRAVWVLLIGGIISAVIAVVLSVHKVRSTLIMGGSAVAMFVVVNLVGERASHNAVDLVKGETAQFALRDILENLRRSLSQTTGVYVAIVIALVIVAVVLLVRRDGNDGSGDADEPVADEPAAVAP